MYRRKKFCPDVSQSWNIILLIFDDVLLCDLCKQYNLIWLYDTWIIIFMLSLLLFFFSFFLVYFLWLLMPSLDITIMFGWYIYIIFHDFFLFVFYEVIIFFYCHPQKWRREKWRKVEYSYYMMLGKNIKHPKPWRFANDMRLKIEVKGIRKLIKHWIKW